MIRSKILKQAKKAVCTDRNHQYGGPEDSFKVIAGFWNIYLQARNTKKLKTFDVGNMMGLLKIARSATAGDNQKADTFIDLAGYAACAAECALGKEDNK